MAKKGVLLIHGLSGSPHELGPVEAALRQAGYATHLAELPGHGDSPAVRFEETSAIEILDHCAAEYEKFSATVEEVTIVGHSLGGICTLLVAAMRPEKLSGIVVFAAPYEHAFLYNHPQGYARMPFVHFLQGLGFLPKHHFACRRPIVPPWQVGRLLSESRVMFRLLREQVSNIDVPVCLAHSLYDMTIPYWEMEKLAVRVGKPHLVTRHTFTQSGHRIFPLSPDVEKATTVILDFLKAA